MKLRHNRKLPQCRHRMISALPTLFLLFSVFSLVYLHHTPVFAAAGDELGSYTYVMSGKQNATATAVDSDGSMVITGYSNAGGDDDFLTIKVNPNGTSLAWAASPYDLNSGTDRAIDVVIDSLSNIIVTGSAHNGTNLDIHTIKYCGSSDTVNDCGPGINQGEVIWQHTYNSTFNKDDVPVGIALDNLNNIYIGGHSQNSAGDFDFLVMKYNSTGPVGNKPIWNKTLTGSSYNETASSIAVGTGIDEVVYVAITGERAGTNNDMLTAKFAASDGSKKWEKIYNRNSGVNDDDGGVVVKIDSAGDVIVAGHSHNGSNLDIYFVKYVGNGATPTIPWSGAAGKTYDSGFGADLPVDMVLEGTDSIYLAGTSYTNTGKMNYYLAKYNNSNGLIDPNWGTVKTYHSGGNNNDNTAALVVNGYSVFITGTMTDTSDPNPANHHDDFLTIKYNKSNGSRVWASPPRFDRANAKMDDHAIGLGLSSTGDLYVGGWSKKSTTDYEYQVVKYEPGTLSSPTDLALSLVSETEVKLDWTANASGEEGYQIIRRICNDSYPGTPNYTIATPGLETYNDGVGLTSHTKYCYKVRAYNSSTGDSSLYSDEASITTTNVAFVSATYSYWYDKGISNHDEAYAISTDPIGFYPVATGYSWGGGSNDIYTVKLDPNNLLLFGGAGGWGERFAPAGNGTDEGHTIVVDSDGDPIVSGLSVTSGSQQFITVEYYSNFNGDSFRGVDIYSTGNPPQWSNSFNGPFSGNDLSKAKDSVLDSEGNRIVVGYGLGAAGTNNDIYLVRYNDDLAEDTWVAVSSTYDNGGEDFAYAVDVDSNGDIYLTGKTHNGTNYDIITRKYNKTTLAAIWTVIYNSGYEDEGTDIAVGSDGDVYVVGTIGTAGNGKNIYVVKYQGNATGPVGVTLWGGVGKSINGPGNGDDYGIGVKVDKNDDVDHVVISGYVYESTLNNEIYVARYPATGNEVASEGYWARTLDRSLYNEKVTSMDMDVSGNVSVAGMTTNDTGDTDMYVVKYSYDGAVIGSTYKGAANKADWGNAVAVNRYGHTFVAGYITAASGTDRNFAVFKAEGNVMQAPAPFIITPYYNHFDLFWSNNNPDLQGGFEVRRQPGDCADASDALWGSLPGSPFNYTTLTAQELGLNIGSQYCYQIRAYKTGDNSRWIEQTVSTIHPPAPDPFTATPINSTRVRLTWTDTLNGEDSFLIQRCEQVTPTTCDFNQYSHDKGDNTNFIDIDDNVAAGTVYYIDTTACEGKTYTYRIQGHKDSTWDSYFAKDADIETSSITAPTLNSVAHQNEGQIDLSWTDNNTDDDMTGFKVYRCLGACTPSIIPASLVKTLDYELAAPAGSIVFLKMDEDAWDGTDDEVSDFAGGNDNGTANNATITTSGVHGNAGVFNGSDSNIDLGDTLSTNNLRGDYTIEMWVKPTNFAATRNIFHKARSGEGSIAINQTTGTVTYTYGTSGTNTGTYQSFTMTSPLVAGEWAHLVLVRDLDASAAIRKLRWYKNGRLINEASASYATATASSNTYPIYVGYGYNGNFLGQIDDFVIYSTVLSLSDIEKRYYHEVPHKTSYSDLPLKANTRYSYLVTAYKSYPTTCDASGWETITGTNVINDITDGVSSGAHVPILDSVIKDPIEKTTHITLVWQDLTDTEEYFLIERCDGLDCNFSSHTDLPLVPANTTTYTDDSACEGGYTYRVKAIRLDPAEMAWESAPSNTKWTSTDSKGAGMSNLQWDTGNSNEEDIALTWNTSTTDESAFEIERCQGASCTVFVKVGEAPRGASGYTDRHRTPNQIYKYKVRAVKNAGCTWVTPYAGPITVDTDFDNAGHGPLVLTVNPETTTRIDLSWNDFTGNETGFEIQRCAGASCTPSAFKYIADDISTYSDTSVCQGVQYTYQVRAIDQGLSNGFGGTWTKMVPISFTSYEANTVVELVVNKVSYSEMQTDFRDMRFYKFTDGSKTDGHELPYFITDKTDGATGNATVWIKPGYNAENIYMFYGNSLATGASGKDIDDMFVFKDDFAGHVIDTTKWKKNDSSNIIIQNNGLFFDKNLWAASSLISKAAHALTRADSDYTFYYQAKVLDYSKYWMAGFWTNQETSTSDLQFVHGIYWNSTSFTNIYERVDDYEYDIDYTLINYSINYIYEMKITAYQDGGATYWVRKKSSGGNQYTTWRMIHDTRNEPSVENTSVMHVALLHVAYGRVQIYFAGVLENDVVIGNATVLTGVNIVNAANPIPSEWETNWGSATDSAITALPPSALDGVAQSESDIQLTWNDNTLDKTGFTLQRCERDDCTFAPLPDIANMPLLLLQMNEAAWDADGATYEVSDRASKANHGTAVGGATTVVNDNDLPSDINDNPIAGRAGSFNGSGSVLITDNDSLHVAAGNAFTIGGWIKRSALFSEMTSPVLLSRLYENIGGYSLSFNTSGYAVLKYCWERSCSQATATITDLDSGTNWHHIAGTFDGTYLRIYVDGVPDMTEMVVSNAIADGSDINLVIGAGFKGLIDDVFIYKNALSAVEISSIMNDGFPAPYAYLDSNLKQNTWYTYRVTSYKDSSDASCPWDETNIGWSLTKDIKTDAPPPPDLTSVIANNTTQVTVRWNDTTTSNTVFDVERSVCSTGTGCTVRGQYISTVSVGTTDGNALTFIDRTACKNTQYDYRVWARRQGFTESLAAGNGGLWTRRALLDITPYQINTPVKVVVPWDEDMQADFDDIRFYDAAPTAAELNYWLESKINGVSATFWVKTSNKAAPQVYMYYGNYNATTTSNPDATFTLYDNFNDQIISASKWYSNKSYYLAIDTSETGEGILRRGNYGNYWDYGSGYINYFRSNTTYTSTRIEEFELQIESYTGGLAEIQDANLNIVLRNEGSGWKWSYYNPGATWVDLAFSPSLKNAGAYVSIKLVRDTTGISVYENNEFVVKHSFSNTASTTAAVNAKYTMNYIVDNWIFRMDNYRVRTFIASEADVTIGAANPPPVNADDDWESTTASIEFIPVTTPDIGGTPTLTSVTKAAGSEAQINLVFTDPTSDETAFEIDRCTGVACNPASHGTKITLTAPVNSTGFADTTVAAKETYCYQVRAVKSVPGSCQDSTWDNKEGWTSPTSGTLCETMTGSTPTGVTATPINTTDIDIAWADNTVSEEGFRFLRCPVDPLGTCPAGVGTYGDITATAGVAGANRILWRDTTACPTNDYYYKVQAYSGGGGGIEFPDLSNDGASTWTRRKPVNFTSGFQANYQTRILVTYDADMKADFSDIRFYDEYEEQELPYWIESKTNGVTAWVWFKTLNTSTSISMYYGNSAAISSSNGTGVFIEYTENLTNGTLPSNVLQNSDGFIVNAGVVQYEYPDNCTECQGPFVEFDVSSGVLGEKRTRIRYFNYSNQYKFYRNDYDKYDRIITALNQTSAVASYTFNAPQNWEIRVKDSTYWLKYNGAQQLTATNLTFSSGTVNFGGWSPYQPKGYFAYVFTRKYAASDPVVVLGNEQVAPYAAWDGEISARTNPVTTTNTPQTPILVSVVQSLESQAILSWTDANNDESYFRIFRCTDSDSSNTCNGAETWVDRGTTGQNVFTFTDNGSDIDAEGLDYGVQYLYKVQAHKTATISPSCDWDRDSNEILFIAAVPSPTYLNTTTVNTTRIDLTWDDTTTNESKFELDRCISPCDFSTAVTTIDVPLNGTDTVTYSDEGVCPGTVYKYRVRPVRSGIWCEGAGQCYSPETTADVTPSTSLPTNLFLVEVYDPLTDQRQINLTWTDTNIDETGFSIERCEEAGAIDCSLPSHFAEVDTHIVNINDTFASAIDPAVWTLVGQLQRDKTTGDALNISNISGSASIAVVSGMAQFHTTSVDSDDPNFNYSQMELDDPEIITNGDFELTFDYTMSAGEFVTVNFEEHAFVQLRIYFGSTNVIEMKRFMDYYAASITIAGAKESATNLLTADLVGKFRVVRLSNVISCYFWINSQWQEMLTHSQDIAVDAVPTAVQVRQYAKRNETQDLMAEIDNFRIDSTNFKYYDVDPLLDPSAIYHYQIRTYKNHPVGCPAWNGLYTDSVDELLNPAPPTDLNAVPMGSRKIKLEWTDNATLNEEYKIERLMFNGQFVVIKTLPAFTESYIDAEGLDPDTQYTYRVRTYRDDDLSYSPYSSEVSTSTNIFNTQFVDDSTCVLDE